MSTLGNKIGRTGLTLREIATYSSETRKRKEKEYLMKKLKIDEESIKKLDKIIFEEENLDQEKIEKEIFIK